VRVDNFILDELNRQSNNQQAGVAAGNNDFTNNNGSTQVLSANIFGALDANCCPTENGDVLGIQAGAGRRKIEVPEVLGIDSGEVFVEVCIPIVPTGIQILFEFIRKQVIFDALVAAKDKVFVNGRLIKTIPFVAADRAITPQIGNITALALGNIRVVVVEVPFSMCIKVKGARQGARVVVLNTEIEEVDIPNLRCPNQAGIRSVTEKTCIKVTVKAEEDTIITVPTTG